MVRVPEAGRFELRLMDGAINPYMAQAFILAAGMDGIANKRDHGTRSDHNMYAEGYKVKDAQKLPLNLLDALRLTHKSAVLRDAFGTETIDSYVKLKMDEWKSYCSYLTQWERAYTLDC